MVLAEVADSQTTVSSLLTSRGRELTNKQFQERSLSHSVAAALESSQPSCPVAEHPQSGAVRTRSDRFGCPWRLDRQDELMPLWNGRTRTIDIDILKDRFAWIVGKVDVAELQERGRNLLRGRHPKMDDFIVFGRLELGKLLQDLDFRLGLRRAGGIVSPGHVVNSGRLSSQRAATAHHLSMNAWRCCRYCCCDSYSLRWFFARSDLVA